MERGVLFDGVPGRRGEVGDVVIIAELF